jgi:hypothetical protein
VLEHLDNYPASGSPLHLAPLIEVACKLIAKRVSSISRKIPQALGSKREKLTELFLAIISNGETFSVGKICLYRKYLHILVNIFETTGVVLKKISNI